MLIKNTWHSVWKNGTKKVMNYKIPAILFMAMCTTGFSQDTLKTNPFLANSFAIVEISKNGGFKDETTIIHFDDGKMTNITDKIYGDDPDLPLAQKVLKCIKYMKERNYVLLSSTSTTIGSPPYHNYNTYDYQYIFEKEKN